MSETHAQRVQRWFDEVWNQQREESIRELLAPDARMHGLGAQALQGPEAFVQFQRRMLQVFSDFHVTVEKVVESGEWVSHHAVARMTHTATGQRCELRGGSTARVVDGRVAETWDSWDFLGLMIQMGALPADALEQAMQGHKFA